MSHLTRLESSAYNALYEFIAEGLSEAEQHTFRDEVKKLIETSQARKLVELLLSHSGVITAKPSERDIEGAYQVIISLLDKLKNPGDLPAVVDLIAKDIRSSDSRPALRLKLLCNFFNLIKSESAERFTILLAIIQYARDTKQLDVLADFFENLDEWRRSWRDLSLEQERRLYLAVSEALEAAGKASEAHRFLLRYLASFGEGDDLSAVQDLAVKGVIGAIKEPIAALTTVSNLLSVKAVKQLETHPERKAVYELLQVFSFKKLSDFLEFQKKNGDVIKRYSIDADKAVHDMRLLSLALLASEMEEIPYTEISRTLEIQRDEVEDWVVRAITAGLIEAKMDQKQETVMISRSVHRHFTKKEWLKLQEKLHGWRRSVESLLTTLKDARAPA